MVKLIDCSIIQRDTFLLSEGCHPICALFIVDEGSFYLDMDGKNSIIKPKDIVIFPKGMEFKRNVLKPVTCHYIQFIIEELHNPYPLPFGKLEFLDQERILSTCRNLKKLANSIDSTSKQLAEHLLCDIIYQHYLESYINPFLDNTCISDPTVERIIDFFKINIKENINIRNLAQKSGLTHAGLIWKFKKATGMTPVAFLISLRILSAKEMLFNTNLTIAKIAQLCGYENAYYFSNYFKKATNYSPSNYRKFCKINL